MQGKFRKFQVENFEQPKFVGWSYLHAADVLLLLHQGLAVGHEGLDGDLGLLQDDLAGLGVDQGLVQVASAWPSPIMSF